MDSINTQTHQQQDKAREDLGLKARKVTRRKCLKCDVVFVSNAEQRRCEKCREAGRNSGWEMI